MTHIRWFPLVLALGAAVAAAPARIEAQADLFVGGAAVIPVGDFGAIADLGYQGLVGGTVDLGVGGFAVGGTGFYGRSPHTVDGDRSVLFGATALVGYTVAEPYGARVRGWAGLGGMVHQRRSDNFPGLDASRRGLSLSGGATVSRSVGHVAVLVSALYTRGLGDIGGSAYPTELVTLGAGLSVPLSLD